MSYLCKYKEYVYRKKYYRAHKKHINFNVRKRYQKYYSKNRTRILETKKKWRLKNPEKIKQAKKRYRIKHPGCNNKWSRRWRLKNKKYIILHDREKRKNLIDSYVKYLLFDNSKNLKSSDIPQPLIEVKRQQIKLRRKLNELQCKMVER